jgi:hypothetical protein
VGWRILWFAIMFFISAWLVVVALERLRAVMTPLIVIVAIVTVAVVIYRIQSRKNRW